MPSSGRGPVWRRDRVLWVLGAIAVVAIVVGVLGTLLAPPAETDADGPEVVALDELDDLRDAVGRQVLAEDVEVERGMEGPTKEARGG